MTKQLRLVTNETGSNFISMKDLSTLLGFESYKEFIAMSKVMFPSDLKSMFVTDYEGKDSRGKIIKVRYIHVTLAVFIAITQNRYDVALALQGTLDSINAEVL